MYHIKFERRRNMVRQKIETQYKWTIDEMYPSESDLNKDIDKVKELIDKLASYQGKLAESKSNLYEALHTSEDAGRILEKLYVYTHMKSHEDTRINDNQGKATKIDMLSTELSMATSYMVPEIISIDEAKLNEYLQDEKLSFYKKYVDEIFDYLEKNSMNIILIKTILKQLFYFNIVLYYNFTYIKFLLK